jgi:DNA repair protein RecN (Recombination protein N)
VLAALSIRNIVIIDALSVAFSPGLTVLTGETGAGKSILLDALALALGGRGDAALVRNGATEGDVAAAFDAAPDHASRALAAEAGIAANDGDLILRRVQGADGRSRAFLNDQPVSVGLLRRIGASLVEIHGQHDERALVEASAHRDMLDAFGGLDSEQAAVASAHAALQAADGAAARLMAEIAAAAAEGAYLRSAVAELTALRPQPDEEAILTEKRAQTMRAEKFAGAVSEAHEIVAGPSSPAPQLGSLLRRLERRAAEAGGLLDAPIAALDRAVVALGDAETALQSALARTQFDPRQLERTEERLFALRAASRKYATPVAGLPALAERLASQLAVLESGAERLAEAKVAADEARTVYDERAGVLSRKRAAAARRLEKAVAAELPALKLERAAFLVAIASDASRPAAAGIDQVVFHVRTNPGSQPGPLMEVASGGELARFLLALKVALADRGSAPTLVFDEVDTAVGGAVADAIGTRLARLGERVQVLSVTHAPQVAAKATSHLLVTKRGIRNGAGVVTAVTPLDARARREEIARMLAGATVTDEARAAADRLILGAA